MAASLDDKWTAIGFGKVVLICDLVASMYSEYSMTEEPVWEQVVNFSSDSTQVVVAYRHGQNGQRNVSCRDWQSCQSPSDEHDPKRLICTSKQVA